MLESLFTEIAIEAIAPRKSLIFSTSDNKSIKATPLSTTKTRWELRFNDLKKSFISRESLDEIPTIIMMLIAFFSQDGDQ